jgi:hypothetical protein
VVDGWAGEVAVHVLFGGGLVGVHVGGEDDVPQTIDVVELGGPEVVGVRGVFGWGKGEFDVRVVPVSEMCQAGSVSEAIWGLVLGSGRAQLLDSREDTASENCDVVVRRVSHVVVVLIANYPAMV